MCKKWTQHTWLLILRKDHLQHWPWLFQGTWNLGQSLPISDKSGSLCLFIQTLYFRSNIYIPSQSLEFWHLIGRGWSVPSENPGHRLSMNSPGCQHLMCAITTHAKGIKHVLCNCTGEEALEACTQSPWDFIHPHFPSVDCGSCPVTAINLTHEYNYLWDPASYLTWEFSWGLLTHT